MGIEQFLTPGNGKIKLKCKLDSYETETLNLETGNGSGYLILDIDEPQSKLAVKLTNERLRNEDCIVYSSKYTREDVFNHKCRYKIIYKYQGENIPKKKLNTDIEVFYNPTYKIAIIGKRNDGYEYLIEGKPQNIDYDINDYLQVKVDFDYLIDNRTKPKRTTKKRKEEKEEEESSQIEVGSGGEEVRDNHEIDILETDEVCDINEFRSIVGRFVELPPVIEQKSETLLTFPCLFPDEHKSKNYAYSFKRNGVYICKCQGIVCQGRYNELNKQIRDYMCSNLKLSGQEGFPKEVHYEGVNIFVAPTGSGKTNACVGEMINAINNNQKLLLILQSKEAIQRLLGRFNELTNGSLELVTSLNKIYIYDSEHKDKEEHEKRLQQANVIISHHYYFINAGDLLTYYNDSWDMLAIPNLKVIIDEAHSFLELATRVDLEIGGLYEPQPMLDENSVQTYKYNIKRLKRDTMLDLMTQNKLVYRTDCVEAKLNGFGTVNMTRSYELYDGVPKINLYKEIDKRFKLINQNNEGELNYKYYINEHVAKIRPNAIENTSNAISLLLDSADSCILALNTGDDIGRRKIGTLQLALFHHQLLERVLKTPKEVILTSATMDDYHYKLVESVCPYAKKIIPDKIEKATHIVLLRNDDENSSRARKRILDVASEVNVKSLFFMPTIEKAKEIIKLYPNTMLNDNDYYCVGRRKSSLDYVDNIERNVTVAGLESGVSKGYNFIEEIDNLCYGFELLYFDKNPISPKIIKKHIIEGNIIDVTSDYNLSTFAQAIGRAFRKSKDVLCIAFNDVEEETYQAVKSYLTKYTTATIHEDILNKTNVKICLSSYIKSLDIKEVRRKLNNNKLFKELYG